MRALILIIILIGLLLFEGCLSPDIKQSSVTPTKTPQSTTIQTTKPTTIPSPTTLKTTIPTIKPTTASAACDCSGDRYNCDDFSSSYTAQACFDYCKSIGRGDVHKLDRDNDGRVCESLK